MLGAMKSERTVKEGERRLLEKIQETIFSHLNALQQAQIDGEGRDAGLHSRASSAGSCARQIAFRIMAQPASNPPGDESLLNFWLGDQIHDLVQTAMMEKYPDAEKELEGWIGDYLSGHLDLRYSAE